ncbi:uncharacterized protein PHALS_01250 [Plasmopara halstedii]|uniref:Uncharacterized protein n=1 Tax=Plasmopara halstedii TaxID=4781 RepID=A0A0P1ASD7_PLAHL|nr:uncharacterized protein PHALS_01250 [Plasmopara halstedii]CEG44926.1 hypothetical protein PHALS_01250 [Plasmopara halstedii]|eukprot:XP_024581295.1 hypothetical protein PHALS_01250 [Plasmopara halstedii]
MRILRLFFHRNKLRALYPHKIINPQSLKQQSEYICIIMLCAQVAQHRPDARPKIRLMLRFVEKVTRRECCKGKTSISVLASTGPAHPCEFEYGALEQNEICMLMESVMCWVTLFVLQGRKEKFDHAVLFLLQGK